MEDQNPQSHCSPVNEGETPAKRGRGRPKFSKNKHQRNSSAQSSSRREVTRSCRTRQSKTKEIYQPKHVAWKVKEKKLLLNALKANSPSDLEAIQRVVKTKTKEEIEMYICRMKKGAVRKIRANRGPKAPIEYWLNLLSDLTSQEKKDYTVNLGKVVSIIANFEEFPPPGPITPDYKAIYRYISGMLSESELPELGKLESAVVLDLLHGLVDFLRSHNTTNQREIMQWKYDLLAGRVDMSDPISALIKARKAIENDFSDFTSENPESSSEPSSSQCTSQQRNLNDNQPGSSSQISQKSSSQSTSTSTASSDSPASVDKNHHSETRSKDRGGASKKRTVPSDSPCPKKPTLFTMNPLCIPVNVIKMKPIINVTIGQLNNVVTPELPSSQRLVAKQTGVVMYTVQNQKISPHPTHPIHRQQLMPVQTKKGRPSVHLNEVYVCEPHPENVIVSREVPQSRGPHSKPKKVIVGREVPQPTGPHSKPKTGIVSREVPQSRRPKSKPTK